MDLNVLKRVAMKIDKQTNYLDVTNSHKEKGSYIVLAKMGLDLGIITLCFILQILFSFNQPSRLFLLEFFGLHTAIPGFNI